MSKQSKLDYLNNIYQRYQKATKEVKKVILDEFCHVCRYNRKYAIRKLGGPFPEHKPTPTQRKRPLQYGTPVLVVLQAVWEAAGYPWSVRLKALLADWMPSIQKRFHLTPEIKKQLLSISARQIDRRLQSKKNQIKKRIYGRTKPGTLLKHQIPIKTNHWDVITPGFVETDTVSHSGDCADGLFAYTVNLTDIHTTWVESRAVLGKGETGVVHALDDMRKSLPFALLGLDFDNGSEFVNHHLIRYCKQHNIQPSRSRPYKKDDNAHIEQKNWTHVRKLMGWDRYDSEAAVDEMNDLYKNELRLFMNLFLPSVKLKEKKRVGSKLTRVYDTPQTPFQRLLATKAGDLANQGALQSLRKTLNPFDLAKTIENKLDRIWNLVHHRPKPKTEITLKSCPKKREQMVTF